MPNTLKRMAYFPYESDKHWNTFSFSSTTNAKMKYASFQRKKVDVAIYLFKTFIKLNKCKKTLRDFVETFKDYASHIYTFTLTDNFQNSKKKGKKEKKTYLKRLFG